jgi:hypothetical protein
MQRKVTWLIVLSFLFFAIVFFCNSQPQGEKDFSDFSEQKKKLLLTSQEISLIAVGDTSSPRRAVYFWDNNAFKKGSEAVVSAEDYNTSDIVFKTETADIDKDSIPEIYSFENGLLTIIENSKIVWQSPNDWWIDNFFLADSNNDGIFDINLSLWKAGNFGSSKPFWVEENDMSIKNHFFIFDFIDDAMKQIWGSSNLDEPNCEFQIADIDNDGKNDLIVVEGDYSQKPKCNGNYVAVWKWNDWGFSNEWRSEKEIFSNLEIIKNDGKNYIAVDSF